MRFLNTILAIYIAALTAFPCTDAQSCVDEKKAGIAMEAIEDHDHSTNEMDFCSPFCICSCCAAHVRLNHINGMSLTQPTFSSKLATLYYEKPLVNNAKSIWQPPKI